MWAVVGREGFGYSAFWIKSGGFDLRVLIKVFDSKSDSNST
jgi:hypothetical protein